jgi:hypothetical protein
VSALYIGTLDTELLGNWEQPLAGDVLMLLTLWGYRMVSTRSLRGRAAFGYGLAWGVGALLTPSLLTAAAGYVLLAGFEYRDKLASFTRIAALYAAGIVLALSPWMVRNYLALGGIVWTRDSIGLELSVSNGPSAHWSNLEQGPRMRMMHPSWNLAAAQEVVRVGELAYFREKREEALRWIGQHPTEFGRLTAQRAFHFWFPPGKSRAHDAMLASLTLAAMAGFALLRRRSPAAFAITAVVWALYPLVYYIVQWSPRYRQPIDWTLMACAGVLVAELAAKVLPAWSYTDGQWKPKVVE